MAVVGGGILGLASAWEISRRRPDSRICVLEREPVVAAHQTGHNSGVIHAGVYYAAGSLKARLCTDGRRRLEEFCEQKNIPFRRAGKLIVATRPIELQRLDGLEERARANGVPGLRRLGPDEIKEVEPHIEGLAALHSPETGIVDYPVVCEALARDLTEAGHTVATGHEVTGASKVEDGVLVTHTRGEIKADRVLFCAGAWSDRLAISSGADPDPRIIPFRGNYLHVKPEKQELVKGMVYPVPDPDLPFLGVHLTRHIDDSLSIGPTALLVGSLQAKKAWSVSFRDAWRTATWPGTFRMAWDNRQAAREELKHAVNQRALLAEAQRFLPALRREDVEPGFSGIRAQAVGRDGSLADDFVFSESERILHVRNAPSPGATSSLAIAAHLADRLESV